MKRNSSVTNIVENTLKDSDLHEFSEGVLEAILDATLNDGILKDIPILGSLISASKIVINFSDRILLKKIFYFFAELKGTNLLRRKEMIQRVNFSENNRIRIGEKILYIIDKSEDHISAKFIALIFKDFLEESISYSEFLRGASIINRLFIEDLERFISCERRELERTISDHDQPISDFENNLILAGICSTSREGVRVRDQDDYKMSDPYIVDGGEQYLFLTDIGNILKSILKPNYSPGMS